MHPRGRGKTSNWGPFARPSPPPPLGTRPPWRPQRRMPTFIDHNEARDDRQHQHNMKSGVKRPSSAPWHNQHQKFGNMGDIWAPIFPLPVSINEESLPKRFAPSVNNRPHIFQLSNFNQGMVCRPFGFPNEPSHFSRSPGISPQNWLNHSQVGNSEAAPASFQTFQDGPLMTARIEDILDIVVSEVKDKFSINAIQMHKLRSTARKTIKDMIIGMPLLPAEVVHQMYRNQHDIVSEMDNINKLLLETPADDSREDISLEAGRACNKSISPESQDNAKTIVFSQDPDFVFQPVTPVTSVMTARISQTVGQLMKELKNIYHISNQQGRGIKQIIYTRMVDIMTGKPLHDEQEMYKIYRKRYPDSSDLWLIKSLGFSRITKKAYSNCQNLQSGISMEAIQGLSKKESENLEEVPAGSAAMAKVLGNMHVTQTVNEPLTRKAADIVKRALTKIYHQMEGKYKLKSIHFHLVRPIVRSRLQTMILQKPQQTARDLRIMYRDQYDLASDEELIKAVSNENVNSMVNNEELSVKATPQQAENTEQEYVMMNEVDSNANADELMYSLQKSEADDISVLENARGCFKEQLKEHTKREATNFKEQQLKFHNVIETKVNDIFAKLIKLFEAEDENNSNGSIDRETDKSGIKVEPTEFSNTAHDENVRETSSDSIDDDDSIRKDEDLNSEEYTLKRSMAQIIPTMLTRFKPHIMKIIVKDRELIKAGMPTAWAGRSPLCPKTLRYAKIFGRPTLPSIDSIREFLELYDPSVLLELRFKTDAPIEALFVGMAAQRNCKTLASKGTYIVGGEIIGVCKALPDVLYKYRNFLKNIDLWNPTTESKDTQTEHSNACLSVTTEDEENDAVSNCKSELAT